MIYYSIVFLCMAGLFLCLLEDRFRFWVTAGAMAAAALAAVGLGAVLRAGPEASMPRQQLPALAGAALFFLASLPLYRNNFLQKLFLALLCAWNAAFLSFALPLILGALPVDAAGGLAGFLSLAATLLGNLLAGLCLYRPFRHFRDRGPSGFLAGMCLLAAGGILLSWGTVDFLFRGNVPAARLLLSAVLYLVLIFCFRSVYQAGRFRERAVWQAAREQLQQTQLDNAGQLLAAVREVQAAEKAGEYALDTVDVLTADGLTDKIPEYVRLAKQNLTGSPILGRYHPDPAVNAVIAAKAAWAGQNDILFECNAAAEGSPLATGEFCLVAGELLSRACRDAAAFDGPKKIRFTVLPGEEALRFEAVYSGTPPARASGAPGRQSLSQLLGRALEEAPQAADDLAGLEITRELIARTSGSLSLAAGGQDEMILQASFRK